MFVQVVQGLVADAEAMRALVRRWADELSPGATGWLGTTAGVTEDAMFVGMARFESEDAARRNSNRLEQGLWWTEASKVFTADVVFHDCQRCMTWMGGGGDHAGFVQVIQGRVRDATRLRRLYERAEPHVRAYRPEIIGAAMALHGDGSFTEAVYFTSEGAAREGERKSPPPELEPLLAEESALLQNLRYFDLREPWLLSPRCPRTATPPQ